MNKQVEKLYKNLDLGIKILKKQYSAILSKCSLNFNSFTRSQQLHKKILECKTFYYSGNRKILDTFCNDFSDIFKMLKVPQNSAALLLQTIDTNETKKQQQGVILNMIFCILVACLLGDLLFRIFIRRGICEVIYRLCSCICRENVLTRWNFYAT